MQRDLQFKKSCGEEFMIPFVEEAIAYITTELSSLEGKEQERVTTGDGETEKYVTIKEQNLKNSLMKQIENVSQFEDEKEDDCFYFYQCSTGENLFLHNVSLKLLHQQYNQNFS